MSVNNLIKWNERKSKLMRVYYVRKGYESFLFCYVYINLEIKEELLKKYYSIYQRLKDSSKVDILYIRERKKKTNDFNLIFSEIMKIREKLNLPLKRTIDVYYNERYNNIFLS